MVVRELLSATKDLCRERRRWLLFANIVIWGLSTFIAVWLLQPYWRQQSVSLRWFGVLWAGTLRRVVMVLAIARFSLTEVWLGWAVQQGSRVGSAST